MGKKASPREPTDLAPITVKSRRRGTSNSKWSVFLDHLMDVYGNEVADYLVIEGKLQRPDRVTGVCVLPILNGRFVLLRFYRHALGSQFWEAPKGFIDVGETPAEAALRELVEETGLACAPEHLVPLGFMAPEASTMAARAALFAATRCSGTLRTDKGEIGLGTVHLFNMAELVSLEAQGGIEDAATLVAYYRFQLVKKPS